MVLSQKWRVLPKYLCLNCCVQCIHHFEFYSSTVKTNKSEVQGLFIAECYKHLTVIFLELIFLFTEYLFVGIANQTKKPFLSKRVTSSGISCKGRPRWMFCLGHRGKQPTNIPTILNSSLMNLASKSIEKH